jgi:tetratricopeptide (TPR) repeat protein
VKQDNASGGYVAALAETLRMKAGLAANELGVLLEESGAFEAAYQAYSRAGQIDPMNVSAAINGYALSGTQKMYPEALDRLRKKIIAATSDRAFTAQRLTWILQNYGTIRQQAYYLQQAETWSKGGARVVANEKIRKAFALSEQAGASSLVENALFYVQTENSEKAEACYLAALEKDAANREALAGISTLMLIKRDTAEAEKWIQKALAAGVGKEAVMYQTITLAVLKKERVQALTLLKEAIAKQPEDLRYWALQAEVLLDQGDTQVVENQLLPEMQKALKNPNHFLVHAVRGFLLRKKGPAHFLPARLSLIRALSLNAALPDIWNAVLELDLALNNPEFTETDARNLLNVDPEHALANYLLGSLLLTRGALREAEDFLRRSIEKRPTAAACNDLAEDLRLQTRLAEAEAIARQALNLEPGLLPAHDTLACILFDLGRYEEAAQTAAKAVAARPSHAPYQLTLLRVQIKQGDKDGVELRRKSLAESKVPIPAALLKEMKEMK